MQRYSAKREAIINCLNMTDTHPTAEWIYNRVHKDYPSMSLATVYRNLKQMKEDRVIASVGIVNDHERFDGTTRPHSHFICEKCYRVIDIDEDLTRKIMNVESLRNCRISSASIEFYGLCDECMKKEND